MKALVTGATGFVGSHLVRALVERGHRVRALVRPSSQVDALKTLGIELFRGDLTRPDTLTGCCDGVDAVLHAGCATAATFDAGSDARAEFLKVNRDGTVNLAREVLKHPGLRMVHVSSTAAMGAPATDRVDETSECRPRSPYQVSKREAELALLDLHARQGLDVVILRPCLVAGEGKADGELLKLFRWVRRGLLPYIGNHYDLEKPLILVDDLIEAIVLAQERGRAGEIYLVHSDGSHTMRQILAVAGRLTGARRTHLQVPLRAAQGVAMALGLVRRLVPRFNPPLTPERISLFTANRRIDIGKARRELGFEPRHRDLDEILGRTYRWYREQGLL